MVAIGAMPPLRALLLLVASLPCGAGFCLRPAPPLAPTRGPNPCTRARLPPLHMISGDEEKNADNEDAENEGADEPERDSYTWAELQADPELRKMEFDSSMNRKNAMFLPQRISAAVTTLGWLFVGGGIILNALGYAWVKDPSGGIGVGTLDERDFQKEVMKEGRRSMEEKQQTSVSSTAAGSVHGHLAIWIENQQDVST